MPTEKKHFDRDGRYTGKTISKTQEEIDQEKIQNAQAWEGFSNLLMIGSVLMLLYGLIMAIAGLLSDPSRLSLPHNIFAYFYHYYFKVIYYIFIFLTKMVGVLYMPIELFDFAKQLTGFENLNTIIWIALIVVYIFGLLWILGRFSLFVAKIRREILIKLAIAFGKFSIVPAIFWIAYFILEVAIIWIFQ